MGLHRDTHQHFRARKMKNFVGICLVCLSMAVAGCSHKSTDEDCGELTEMEALRLYELAAKGDFAGSVAAMESCDSTTDTYRKQMELRLKHHYTQMLKERGGYESASVTRMEMHTNGRMANVFLQVTYADSTSEEVLFPLVFDGEHWRIQ